MKYLITGGAGFIGLKLAEELLKNKKNKVFIIDNFSKNFGSKNLKKILKNRRVRFLKKDLNNIKDYPKILKFNIQYKIYEII